VCRTSEPAFAVVDAGIGDPVNRVDLAEGSDVMSEGNAAATPLVAEIASAWTEVLGVEPPDFETNFFQIGGNSLQVARVIGRLRTAIDPAIPLKLMFIAPTISGLAREIEAFQASAHAAQAGPAGDDHEEGEL
jgi:acyl carrier protein